MTSYYIKNEVVKPIAKQHNWLHWFILLFCLGLAFLVRIYGVDFGLPYEFHPDEDQYVDEAIKWHLGQSLDFRFFNPPLFTFVLIAAYKLWFAFSPFEPSADWITGAYVFARWWSTAFSTLTVALAYPLGKRLWSDKAGLLAVALLAGLFLPAREAHFAVNDAALTFLVLLSHYFLVKLIRRRQRSTYLAAGVAVGLTIATKYMGGLILLSLLGAHLLALSHSANFSIKNLWRPAEHRHLGWGLLAILLTFLSVCFYYVLNFIQVIYALAPHLNVAGYEGTRMVPGAGWQFYLDVLGWGMGWVMLILVGVVLIGTFVYRYKPGMILAIFPVTLFAFMGSHDIVFARYLLPAFPPLVILVAIELTWWQGRWSFLRQKQALIWPVLVAVLLAQPLTYLIWFDYLLTLPDTRELATKWLTEQFPPQTIVASERFSVFPDQVFLGRPDWPYVFLAFNEGYTLAPKNDMNHFLTRKAEVVVLSNFTSGRVREDPAEEQLRQEQIDFWNDKAVLVKTFSPYHPNYESWFYQDQFYGPARETLQRVLPGPLISIYRLPFESQPYRLDLPYVPIPVQANFAGQLMLLGYELSNQRAQPGEAFHLTLYWQALTRMDKNYVIFNHLLDSQQQNWGGYDRLPQEMSKTTLWQSGEMVIDTFDLPIASEAPDGVYTIDIGLYHQADPPARPLPIIHEGQPVGRNSVRIGPVKIGGAPPQAAMAPAEVKPKHPLAINLGEPSVISLRGYELVEQAEAMQLTLYWESLAQTPVAWTTFVHLVNERGEIVAQKDEPTGGGIYPSNLWDAGEIIAEHLVLPIPTELKAGQYSLLIGLYQLETGQRLPIPASENNTILLSTFDVAYSLMSENR